MVPEAAHPPGAGAAHLRVVRPGEALDLGDHPGPYGPGILVEADGLRAGRLGYLVSHAAGRPTVMPVAQVRGDRLEASLDLRAPASDERPLERDELDDALAAAGVVHGLDVHRVDAAWRIFTVRGELLRPMWVARGEAPVPGRPERIDWAPEVDPTSELEEGEDGRIDFHMQSSVRNLAAGQVLGVFVPGGEARSGRGVDGVEVELPVGMPCQRPQLGPDGERFLFAAKDAAWLGQPGERPRRLARQGRPLFWSVDGQATLVVEERDAGEAVVWIDLASDERRTLVEGTVLRPHVVGPRHLWLDIDGTLSVVRLADGHLTPAAHDVRPVLVSPQEGTMLATDDRVDSVDLVRYDLDSDGVPTHPQRVATLHADGVRSGHGRGHATLLTTQKVRRDYETMRLDAQGMPGPRSPIRGLGHADFVSPLRDGYLLGTQESGGPDGEDWTLVWRRRRADGSVTHLGTLMPERGFNDVSETDERMWMLIHGDTETEVTEVPYDGSGPRVVARYPLGRLELVRMHPSGERLAAVDKEGAVVVAPVDADLAELEADPAAPKGWGIVDWYDDETLLALNHAGQLARLDPASGRVDVLDNDVDWAVRKGEVLVVRTSDDRWKWTRGTDTLELRGYTWVVPAIDDPQRLVLRTDHNDFDSYLVELVEPRVDRATVAHAMERLLLDSVFDPNAAASERPELRDTAHQDPDLVDAIVDAALDTLDDDAFFQRLDEQVEPYLAVVEELRAADLPEALAGIPYATSRYLPEHQRPYCGKGLWGIMPETAHRLGLRVEDCRFHDEPDARFTPTMSDVLVPIGRNVYVADGQCRIPARLGCAVDERTDPRKATRAMVQEYTTLWTDPDIRESGAAVQLTIAGHWVGGERVRDDYLAWRATDGGVPDDQRPLVFGQQLTCDALGYGPGDHCGGFLPNDAQRSVPAVLAWQALARCFYGQEHGGREAFAPWTKYADGACAALPIPTRAELTD
mgnify:CR=1 FL=1